MGKTRTVVIGSDEQKTKKQKGGKKKPKLSVREEKGVKIPGLKGGERIVAVDAGPIIKKEEETKVKKGREKKSVQKAKGVPKVRGKKYIKLQKNIEKSKYYSVKNAVKLVKKSSFSKFNGSVELHLVVNKIGFSTTVDLPHLTGKQKRVELATDKTIEKIKKGKIDFDVLLATSDMMSKLVPFASQLGPKGLMPNPKNKTVIKNKEEAKKFSVNSITLKTERKAPLIHTVVGKINQSEKEITDNIKSILSAIGKRQVLKAYISATMGPSIKLDITRE
jgi:large subunit ribosomal protein L1